MIRQLSSFEFPGAPEPALQHQPAGFDLTVSSIARFRGAGCLDFTNAQRRLPALDTISWESDPEPVLLTCGGYLVTYNEEVSIPADCAGIVLPRSSLMRCGATLHSALWDPGYRGRGQGLMSVFNPLELHRNARIAQLIMITLETAAEILYSGKYQGENT